MTSPPAGSTIRSSSIPTEDSSFDAQFPRYVRERSAQYWTPVAVAARAAAIFHEQGATRILDVGCGPGKFCVVAGCQQPDMEVHGIEQRSRLVRVGTRLARQLDARNVRLWAGDVMAVPWHQYDGLYFFNPFGENVMHRSEQFDDKVTLSSLRFGSDLLRVESLLDHAPVGTVIVTYFGLGGPIPFGYELVGDERIGADRLRTWVQRNPRRRSRSAWIESIGSVLSVSRRDIHCALASLIGDEAQT